LRAEWRSGSVLGP